MRLKTTQSFQERTSLLFSQATVDDFRQVLELQQKIAYVRELLGDQGVSVPGLLDGLVNSLLSIWGTELYIAEETRPIAGEKVTTYSAVTLGKILRLALILIIGWILLRFFARQLRALLLRRANADVSKAEMIRSWTFGIGLTLLLIYGLKVVHIPFTAFAFLGGTLAIGIGFGAQNLLKNFISGVILDRKSTRLNSSHSSVSRMPSSA